VAGAVALHVRLSLNSPGLPRRLRAEPEFKQRLGAKAVTEWIIVQRPTDDPRVAAGLDALRSASFGRSDAREGVRELADTLEVDIDRMRETAGLFGEQTEINTIAESEMAVRALWFSLSADAFEAVTEATYLAQWAVNTEPDGIQRVESVLFAALG